MEKIKNFYKNKRILVTGATGFKGSWLCAWLLKLGAKVYGTGYNPNQNKNLFYQLNLNKKINLKLFDIRDYTKLKNFINSSKTSIIFHLAAQPLIYLGYQKPHFTSDVNYMGTLNILEIARVQKFIKSVVIITTDKCYENIGKIKSYKESDKLGGVDPYSSSKAAAELMIRAYRESFFRNKKNCGISSARAGNVIGGGDWAQDRLIPDIFKAISKKETVIIRSPKAIRPWQHVLEPLSGYMLLAQRLFEDGANFIGGWNFGPEKQDAKPVAWVVDEICRLWGNEARYEITKNPQPHEANILMLDSSKSNQKLNWKPTWGLSTALKNTVDWYQAYQRQDNMRDVTRKQIVNFRK